MLRKDSVAHADFVVSAVRGGPLPVQTGVDERVVRSWRRSLAAYHLDPGRTVEPRILTGGALKDHQVRLETFSAIAKHGITKLHEQLRDAGYVILLTDSEGVTVDFAGASSLERELRHAGLYLGSCWSEREEGTCGVGTCIVDQVPMTVHKAEHFRAPNITLTCTAAPLFGPEGQLLGVLDASALYSPDDKKSQLLVAQLVSHYARLIEDANLLHQHSRQWVLKFNTRREFLEVQAECLAVLDEHGQIICVNRAALRELGGKDQGPLLGRHVGEIFSLGFEDFPNLDNIPFETILPLRCPMTGKTYFGSLRSPSGRKQRAAPVHADVTPVARRGSPCEQLDMLAGSDSQMMDNVARAKRVMNLDIPILLMGETGTGKEAFAKAIHLASDRGNKPFVALNCAAIPESLIESELFGYSEGAFTGARVKGMRGKIAQSSGGTLFLDEIGDMPLQLQTRLLRALAEREVLPLGGESPLRVDLHVICATHQNIPELVVAGRFREDLYFRLNGMTLRLPNLRDRSDRAALIESVLVMEAGEGRTAACLSPEVQEALLAYGWPGNIRELHSALRYALAVGDDGLITLADLPLELKAVASDGRSHGAGGPTIGASAAAVEARAAGSSQREELMALLKRHHWGITGAARELGVCRATVYRRMKRLGIVPPHLL